MRNQSSGQNAPKATINPTDFASALSRADAAIASANQMLSKGIQQEQGHGSSGQSRMGGVTLNSTIKTSADVGPLPGKHAGANQLPTMKPPPATISAPTVPNSAALETPRTQNTLDLRENDNQFHVIATLITTKYEKELEAQATSITLTAEDKQQLDRMVSRDNFVAAVRSRLATCPRDSMMPVHLATRKCEALGLHRSSSENLLYAPAGTVIPITPIDVSALQPQLGDLQDSESAEDFDGNPENLARQQLLAELREASTLMAESVTPEAAQFWRKHVVELQTRLRALHEPGTGGNAASSHMGTSRDTEEYMRRNEKLLASLQENTGYVPPDPDEFSQTEPPRPSSHYMQGRSAAQQYPQAQGSTDPELEGIPMVDVVSPANLPEGYTFEAEIDNKRFLATVPQGGVRKGETFSCYMQDLDKVSSGSPVGRWRDGLFDCFKHGLCHPVLLNAFACPLIALAQVMTRMGLDFTGRKGERVPKTGFWSTWGMAFVILSFWAVLNAVVLAGLYIKASTSIPISPADVMALVIINIGMYGYIVYATTSTRTVLRERYLIRESAFVDLEDLISSAACLPCTVSQMARHTANYENHAAVCCNDTGIPEGVVVDDGKQTSTYRIW